MLRHVVASMLWTLAVATPIAPLRAQTADSPRAGSATLWSTLATVAPMTAGVVLAATGSGGTGQTVASGALFWGGAVVGPATGYWHGNAGKHPVRGLVLRTATFAVAWALAPTSDYNDGILPNPDSDRIGVWVAATAVIGVSAVIDIATVGRSVRLSDGQTLTVLPLIDVSTRRVGFTVRTVW